MDASVGRTAALRFTVIRGYMTLAALHELHPLVVHAPVALVAAHPGSAGASFQRLRIVC
jgi:hypothetical protein